MVLTRNGQVHSWGHNDMGQLGHNDTTERTTPTKITALKGKIVTAIALGHDFVVALGKTLP